VKAIALRVVLLVIAAATAFLTVGAGTSAAADPYEGKTYAYAAEKIESRGGKAVIATVVGSQLATNDCIVTSSRKPTYVKKTNFDHDKETLLSLSCVAALAHAGEPGNSLMSAEGQAQKKVEVKADQLNSNPSRCAKYLASCEKFCNQNAGMCSKEVTDLF
jgi:hypothetical protein